MTLLFRSLVIVLMLAVPGSIAVAQETDEDFIDPFADGYIEEEEENDTPDVFKTTAPCWSGMTQCEGKYYWTTSIQDPVIMFGNIDKKVKKFEIICDNDNKATFEISTGWVWVVPPDWRQCEGFVYGGRDASFEFENVSGWSD